MKKFVQILAVGVLLLLVLPGMVWASPDKQPKAGEEISELCASPIWATKVVSFDQGLRLDGEPVLGERSDPSQALGAPNDVFVSLGFGGSITVRFKRPVFNPPGPNDFIILVQETTWFNISGDYPLEQAEVRVIAKGREYPAGMVYNRDGDDTSGLGIVTIPEELRKIDAVKLLDKTARSGFDAGVNADPQWDGWYNADAFDLDAVGTCGSLAE
jgi:hypothetical protein